MSYVATVVPITGGKSTLPPASFSLNVFDTQAGSLRAEEILVPVELGRLLTAAERPDGSDRRLDVERLEVAHSRDDETAPVRHSVRRARRRAGSDRRARPA